MASSRLRPLIKLGVRAPCGLTQSRRPFHSSTATAFPYKDTQDRESLNPSGTEGTKTGRDSDVARDNPDAAFNPNKTSPETEKRTADEKLDVSGAAHDVSKPQGDEKTSGGNGSPVKEIGKGGKSSGASPPKKGKPLA